MKIIKNNNVYLAVSIFGFLLELIEGKIYNFGNEKISADSYKSKRDEPSSYSNNISKYSKTNRRIDGVKENGYKDDDNIFGIIGGRNATPGEFPHMGSVGWKAVRGKWIFKCGGSLISLKFVLTAAHCSQTAKTDSTVADIVPKIVRLGTIDIRDDAVYVDVKIFKIIVHPKYASPKKYHDIALLELQKQVTPTKFVQPACLWKKQNAGDQAIITGWGRTDTASQTTSPILQVAVVDLIDSNICDEQLRPSCNRLWCGVEDHQICAGKQAGGIDACQGDSGGPLQINATSRSGCMYYIIGVTSFGFGCARRNTPGLYSKVSKFVNWIESII